MTRSLCRVGAYTFLGSFAFLLGIGVTADLLERLYGRPQSRPPVVPSPRPPTELRLAGGSTYTTPGRITRITYTTRSHP